jgi:hypothetical protein
METQAWNGTLPSSDRARRAARSRSLSNLLHMGHCAPTVARTLLDLTHAEGEWLVRLAAGLPGGIGNSGGECGGITAPLLLLGLRSHPRSERGLPVILEEGHAYCQRFLQCHGALHCRTIWHGSRLPWPCIQVVRRAPELLAETIGEETEVIPPRDRAAYQQLLSHFATRGFHCAHAVLRGVGPAIRVTPGLLAATAAFTGGTLLKGLTCSALAAGVMALGLGAGELEWSRLRIARMLVTMAAGGDALADGLNAFNGSIRRGHGLARWFEGEFGSTQCRDITGCAFSSPADVERYVRGAQVMRCEVIARRVAEAAREILERAPPVERRAPS